MEDQGMMSYWWEIGKSDVNKVLFGVVRFLDQNQGYRQQANIRHMRLYGNLNVLGLTANTYSQTNALNSPFDRISLNIIQSCCDTVTNKIAKNKPKPTFLTSGGDYTLKKKAKNLDKFVQGQFYALDFFPKAQMVFRDACVFGTGALKIYREDDKICAERVFVDELQVDDSEAIHGTPRSMYQRKYVAREVLARMFPKAKDAIMHAPKAEQHTPAHKNISNNVLVVEAWHLPSNKEATDGRHVICIDTATLVDEKYEKEFFPFVFMRWNPMLLGFWGQGLAEQLVGLQVEINKILRTIQLSFHLMGSPAIFIENGSGIVSAHLSNEVGRIIKFSGTPPIHSAPNPVAPQLLEHLNTLYNRAYEIAGISALSAQSKKPGGLDSGRALREFNDIESERFITVGQMHERFYVDAAKQLIDLAKDIYTDLGEYSVKVKGRKFLEKIDWKDVDLEEDEYMMQVFPTSSLSQTPAGRLQDIQELIQAGFIDKNYALKLLDYPDLEGYMNLANAAIEDIEDLIEKIVDKGEYNPPEPYQNIIVGVQMCQNAYLKYRADGLEEEKLELLRRWMSEAQAMVMMAQEASAPAPMAPQAVPVAPPVSDILPNAPTQGV
jgi:hypothetical protein